MKQVTSFLKTLFNGDSHRILLLSIIVLLIFLLGIYSHSVGTAKDKNFRQILIGCLSETKECPQQSVVLSTQIKSVKQGYFTASVRTKRGSHWEELFDQTHDLKVLGEEFQLTVGDIIVLKGYFFSPQILILENYQREGAWVREFKYGISLLALVLTGLIWLRTFGFSLRQFIFFRKENS